MCGCLYIYFFFIGCILKIVFFLNFRCNFFLIIGNVSKDVGSKINFVIVNFSIIKLK